MVAVVGKKDNVTPQSLQTQEQLDELARKPKDTRPIHVFDVPPSIEGATSLGFVELTANEELMAARRSGGDAVMLSYELCKEALREVSGRRVSMGDGTADVAWASLTPQLRTLAVSAYTHVNAPKGQEVQDFLKSRRIEQR